MRISIDWFIDTNNPTGTAHAAYHETSSDFEALEWLKSVVKEHNIDEEHVSQIVVDGYNREDLKLCLFRETTFVIGRKLSHEKGWDTVCREHWNGDKSWVDYKDAKHYDSKDEAMEVAKVVAYGREFCYLVEEVDEYGFVVMAYEV